ncbi:ATP-binding protein [Umezawaea sp. Da 62-37]|uniref:sensor histidine kinase n=1 Tax=Umezawaea sp. Da 62-37 TaxID=3075927 RepID=UPI0028F6EC29|nr:ATP-binding protein [Umezawaea sp. Da 62-37]WNV91177.1 ATP-binding protein [Umezawaea sp. Da 62-37]
MGVRGTLARQLLAWQLVVVVALLCAVGALSVVQARANFATTEGRRMQSVAEDVATTAGVRAALADPARQDALAPFAESGRSLSGASYVVIADASRRVMTPPGPLRVGEPLDVGPSTALGGRSWVGELDGAIVAHVPVMSDGGEVIGVVAAGEESPGFFEGVLDSPGDALRLLGIALAIGVVGSLLLTRRVEKQTLGLEPREITELVEHREALLHGTGEGVVGLDPQHRITLANDHARTSLGLPADCVGRAVADLDFEDRLLDVLTGRAAGADQVVLRGGSVLTMNRTPIAVRGVEVGSVVTLRDRTELMGLRNELDANRHATDTLRAQAHEFGNRLHTISGLIELGEYDEVRGFVSRIGSAQGRWEVGVEDFAVGALLVAKAGLAAERGVGLRMDPGSRLGVVDGGLSTDLVTVVGNLVDNAVDAVAGSGGWVEVLVREEGEEVLVVVRDSGPGVAPGIVEEVFRNGFTTKAAEEGERGLGLALTRQICLRRGGVVGVRNEEGAVFTARLPW